MKTNKQNKVNGLPSRPEQSSTTEQKQQSASAPAKQAEPYVNYKKRDENRQLPTERVLELLKQRMPRQWELAEVVGKWIWIRFQEEPVEKVRAELSQLGFHWNNLRKCWQYPCGQFSAGTPKEPREKYQSYFAAKHQNPQTNNAPARTAEQVPA